jgi:sortase A
MPSDDTPYKSTSQNNDDLLAELREKTARLAAQVGGKEESRKNILEIEVAPKADEEVIDALMAAPEKNKLKSNNASLDRGGNPAVELVREKLAKLYGKEPSAETEAEEVETIIHRSKHQQFMYELTTSGKSLADIQTEWHHYYTSLPDDEKHQVWREFYENQEKASKHTESKKPAPKSHKRPVTSAPIYITHSPQTVPQNTDQRTVGEVKSQLFEKINAGGKLTPMHHVKSLLFGLSLAAFVGLLVSFTLFNEVFIAPFISPARSVSATPIIGSQTGDVGPEAKIIIPKINLEVPVVFDMDTVAETEVQKALEGGVVHYASTPNPGEQGNSSIVGHSSNNILNSGKYKFAFVLLKRLEAEDTFFVQKDGIRYTYKVYKKEIVSPDNVAVLGTQDRPNTMTLITCDPPGTSLNRLIIVGEQISPDPNTNKQSTAIEVTNDSTNKLPSNAPTLWSRLWPF